VSETPVDAKKNRHPVGVTFDAYWILTDPRELEIIHCQYATRYTLSKKLCAPGMIVCVLITITVDPNKLHKRRVKAIL